MNRKSMFRLPFALVGALLLCSPAFAQTDQDSKDNQDDENLMEEVVVTGVKYSLTQAVDIKKTSMQIVDAIVAEDIGKFPDNNVVEAMQRIPGVQVTNRGGGEISTVSIRGLGDVTTTVNGRNIFTSSGRQVALADIPATLVNRVDVYKTRSPSQISRGLAGQIDIHTNRPFDFEGFEVAAQARGIYSEQADKTDPNLSFLISNRWNTNAGEFGALLNVSYVKTNYRDQEVDAGAAVPFLSPDSAVNPLIRFFPDDADWDYCVYCWTPGTVDGLPFAAGSTLPTTLGPETPYVLGRDAVFQHGARGERKRPAANLSLEWAPDDRSTYMFEVFYDGYRNTQLNELFFSFVDWWGAVDPNDPVELYPGTNVVHSRYVNFPYEFTSGDVIEQETDSYLYALSGEWDLNDDFTLKSDLYYQDSDYHDTFLALRTDKVSPRLFVDFNQGNGVPYMQFFDNPDTPQDESDQTDPSQWNLANLYDNGQHDQGDAWTWTADGDYKVEWGWINTVSFGVRYDDRSAQENGYTSGDRHCNDAPGCAGKTYMDFPGLFGVISNFFDGQAKVVDAWTQPSLAGMLANQEALRAAYGYLPLGQKTFINEFMIDERQYAGYVQADFSTELANGGFLDGRFGFRYLNQKADMSFPDPDTGGRATATNKNDTVLPSLMVRWGIREDLIARFSYTEVFELPTFPQLNPYIQYFADVTNIGYGTAAGGNKDLKPIESQNYDISLEWYFADGGVVYATWFKRDITNNVINAQNVVQYDDPTDNPDRGLYTYILSQPDNAGAETLDGWEFGLTWFPELPGWFNGLGIQASYTKLNSETTNPIYDAQGNITGYSIGVIPGVSDNSYSVILAYDRQKFSARLSYFWRDDFYDRNEATLFANPLHIWKSAEESLDFQFNWNISDQWTLTFDATNLTDPIFSQNYGNNPTIFNFLNPYYTRTFALGVRYQL